MLPKALMWHRLDGVGVEQTLLSDASGLYARGTQLGVETLPYTCRYELYTDETWATVRFEATVEGAGFLRNVRLERASGRWRVTANEQGDLDAAVRAAGGAGAGLPGVEEPGHVLADAVDIDLAFSPLTNTLPVRRLGLPDARPGTSYELGMAFITLPDLEVVHSAQTYTVVGPAAVHFRSAGFQAELALDPWGYVLRYPGLAERA